MKFITFCLIGFILSGCGTLFRGDSSVPETGTPPSLGEKHQPTVKKDLGLKKRIMILPFLDSSAVRPPRLREKAQALFFQDSRRRGEIVPLDSRELKFDLTKQIKDGEYVLSEVAKAAGDFGAFAVFEGKLIDLKVSRQSDPVGLFRQMKTRYEVSVRVRMALTKSGKEIFNMVKTITREEAQTRVGENASVDRLLVTAPEVLEKLVASGFIEFAPQIYANLSKFNWEGRIASISGDRIFLNVGKVTGLQIGDLLRVTEEGEEIFDPRTGNFIGKSPGRLKGTLEVIGYFGQDGAISVIHSGGGFIENDRVESY